APYVAGSVGVCPITPIKLPIGDESHSVRSKSGRHGLGGVDGQRARATARATARPPGEIGARRGHSGERGASSRLERSRTIEAAIDGHRIRGDSAGASSRQGYREQVGG